MLLRGLARNCKGLRGQRARGQKGKDVSRVTTSAHSLATLGFQKVFLLYKKRICRILPFACIVGKNENKSMKSLDDYLKLMQIDDVV